MIDGVSGGPQIAWLWSTKFKKLYNRCNPSTRNSLQEQLSSIITEDDLEALIVDTDTVVCAIKRLKAGKSDEKSLMSVHVLYAPPILASKLSCLFTALLRVAWIYIRMLLSNRDSVMQPIPKGFKDSAMSAHYCSTALVLCFTKITGTLHSDAISRCVLHFRPAVWVREGLLY